LSEPKLISPLLDGYSIGTAISDHDGVCCTPAVKENSENKYIVKVISIPASQTQLDALLLTGAYKDPASAMDYFKELTDGVIAEAECLKKLSKLEGFLPYDNWQVVPMERNKLGYDVYLISSYKRSLARYMKRNTMTHLGAVNLGLDMCAALAIARRAGWMYVDLKPTNIFISDDREYRIGDLGFMRLDSLKFSSLPRKYCSAYSAPEAQDVMSTLNDTIDTYAVGMLLYQIYNNGQLPAEPVSKEKPLDPPANADYEMAEIILKACAPKPQDRWADPMEMGQALVAYMQRNSVNDTPIMPPSGAVSEDMPALEKQNTDETLPNVEIVPELTPEEMSEEMSTMVTQADELISHDAPEPVVVPTPTPIEDLQSALDTPAQEAREQSPSAMPTLETETSTNVAVEEKTEPAAFEEPDPVVNLDEQRRKNRRKRSIGPLVALILLLALLAGGFWFYRNKYLLTIHALEVEPSEDFLTVILDTQIDNSMLSVVCTDIYGNTMTSPVANNKAVFTELLPDMLYKIRVEVTGFHALEGSVTHEYMTPSETNITSFSAAAGSEDGSALLNFTFDGIETEDWILRYQAEEEEAQVLEFSGQSVSVSGLTIGKTYTFVLESASDLNITGQTTVEFTPRKTVIASDLQVSIGADNTLMISWSAPEDAQVNNWIVHCYSSDGYDKSLTVSEMNATFDDISTGSAYTIEVLAEGMNQPARTNVTADPAAITEVSVNDEDPMKLTVSWEFDGSEPATGWILLYTIDGSSRQEVVKCETNSAVIEIRVPGATYDMTIQAADGSSVFNNTYSYKCPNAEVYKNNDVYFYADTLNVHLLKTPSKTNWSYKDVGKKNYTSTFKVGDPISVLLHHPGRFYLERFDTHILYVIRNSEGNVMTELLATDEQVWRTLWENTDYRYCELNLPAVPTAPGEYTLYLYFNGRAVTSVEFTITE